MLWVRVDLARIGMIAEFSTLRFSPLLLHQMKNEREGERRIYLWRVELARLRISTHQFGNTHKVADVRASAMIHEQVHLLVPCYDFYPVQAIAIKVVSIYT